MKKSRIITAIVSTAVIAGSIFTLGACSDKIESKNQPANAEQTVIENAITTAKISEITADEAIGIAFKHAGVSENEAVLEIGSPELDKDDAVPHFSIDFSANGYEYDYEIGLDGSIIESGKEIDDHKAPSAPAEEAKSDLTKAAESKAEAKGFISIDSAKNAALKHAGLNASNVEFKKARLDTDDRFAHYDIEFVSDGIEYEYEINAQSGKVSDFDKERYVKEKTRPAVDTSSYISASEAKSIAFKKAGVDASSISRIKCQLDTDDMFAHYEIEFISGNYEYDFDINAKTGKIIESGRERAFR